ncbi:MAG: putative Ig domain-containing protein [Gemmataceae bacterium]
MRLASTRGSTAMMIYSRLRISRATQATRLTTFRPFVEALEERAVPTTLTVTNLNGNTSSGSLRGVLASASSGDTIVFDSSLKNGTITLGGAVSLNTNVTIDGGSNNITISGATFYPVFIVNSGTTTIENLSVTNGNGANNGSQGGGLYVRSGADVTLANVSISNSRSSGAGNGEGGGVYNAGTLEMTNCTIASNTVGGGVYSTGDLTAINCTIAGNTGSGILIAEASGASTLRLANSIIAGNTGTDVNKSFGATGISGGGNVYGTSLQFAWTTIGSYPDVQTSDSLLGTLQNNGGSSSTMAPLPGSSALGTGSPDNPSFGTLPSTDARGYTRIYHGSVDSGAFQNQSQWYTLTAPPSQPYAIAGSAASLNLGSFQYTGTATSWTVSVDWGDGSSGTSFTVSSQGTLPVQSHTFTQAGTYTPTITITSNGDFKQMATTVAVGPALAMTTTSLATGTVGNAYSQLITAEGGSGGFTFSTTDALPAGLSLSGSGVLSGTPTAGVNASNITVTVTVLRRGTPRRRFSLTINPALIVGPASVPVGIVGVYSGTSFTATGGSGTGYTFAATGSLDGLAVDAATGALSGTPTATGTFSFTVTATDAAGGTGSQTYIIVVYSPLSLATVVLPTGTTGHAYLDVLTASGGSGTASYAITGGALPAGLSLSSTGILYGTPTTAGGPTSFTVTATDAVTGQTASQSFSLTIQAPVTLTPASLASFQVGVPYSQTFTATGGSGSGYTFAVTSGVLPDGLTLNGTTGELSGTPTAATATTFTITATDDAGATGSRDYTLGGAAQALVLRALSFGQWTVNRPGYAGTIAVSGGAGAYEVTRVTGLPPGITANIAGDLITLSGTPTRARAYTVSVTVTDAAGATATRDYAVTVLAANTFAWTGAGGDDLWSNATNWSGAVPGVGATLIFPAGASRFTSVNDLTPGTKFASLVFQNQGFTISGNAIGLSRSVTSSGTNTLNLNLALSGRVTFDVSAGKSLTVAGVVTGTGAISKTGTGTLVLSSANTYSGGTAIQGGTLLATNGTGSATGTGTVTVNRTATLSGPGAVGPLTVWSGGTLRPAAATPTLLHTGNLTMSSGSVYAATLNGPGAGTGYDAIDVTGTVNLSSAVLQLAFGFAPAVGDTFTLIANDGTDAVRGMFTGWAEGASVLIGGETFQMSYHGGDGNDVVLTRLV